MKSWVKQIALPVLASSFYYTLPLAWLKHLSSVILFISQ